MKTPPFLLGAALLFWGWQTGFLVMGAVLAVVFELSHWTNARWEFSDDDFTRIWTFCSLLLLVSTLYAFTSNEAPSEVMNFLQNPSFRTQRDAGNSSARSVAELIRWQPMIFFPFIAAAVYSVREGVPLHTISLILRRRWKKVRRARGTAESARVVNVSYPYFGVCLFASTIQPATPELFFPVMCVLVGWALWPWRSRRFALTTWAAALLVVFVSGFYGQRGILELQQFVGGFNPSWLSKYSKGRFDPRHSRTMIGQVGRMKTSGNIVIRVETPEGGRVPQLLREASYRGYKGQVWYSGSSRTDFVNVPQSATNATSYLLIPEKEVTTPVKIACSLPGNEALLPLPRGTAQMNNLQAYIVEKNSFGAVHATGPGLVIFDALYGPGATIDAAPDSNVDGAPSVPERELPALQKVIEELNLENPTLHQAMQAIQSYFATNFTYKLWEEMPVYSKRDTPLGRFLLKTKAGHCEYFATATVLLMRQLGFSARYAVGYAVHETSGDNKYVVRQRHAHAWALVWNNGVWLDLDTTPGSWIEAEAQRASSLQWLSDIWSRIKFEIARVRWGQSHLRQYLLWSSLPVLGVLLVRIFRSRRKQRKGAVKDPLLSRVWPGADSEFYQLEAALSRKGLKRASNEPMSEWLPRAAAASDLRLGDVKLQDLLELHYRYRFDPAGLTLDERAALREAASVGKGRAQT